MTLAYSLRAAPDMTVEEHPCCTDDMVDELRFYAFMMSSDLSFRTRAAATLENLTPSASDSIRVRAISPIRPIARMSTGLPPGSWP